MAEIGDQALALVFQLFRIHATLRLAQRQDADPQSSQRELTPGMSFLPFFELRDDLRILDNQGKDKGITTIMLRHKRHRGFPAWVLTKRNACWRCHVFASRCGVVVSNSAFHCGSRRCAIR